MTPQTHESPRDRDQKKSYPRRLPVIGATKKAKWCIKAGTEMNLSTIIAAARERRASDVHLEAGLPLALRVASNLQITGDPLSAEAVSAMARQVVGEDLWPEFLQRGSSDLSRTIEGVRCRINVMQTARGPGLAIRLLSSFQATIERLNLHPDLKRLVANPHGLVLVSGPTGSGKSSTLAALVQEINLS